MKLLPLNRQHNRGLFKNSRAAEFYRSAGFLELESNSNNPSYSMFFAFRRKTLN